MNAQRIAVLAWCDWLLFLVFTFPAELAGPFVLFAQGAALSQVFAAFVGSMFAVLLLAGMCAGVAKIVDAVRGGFSPQGEPLDANRRARLVAALQKNGIDMSDALLSTLRVHAADLSIGAHLRGVVRQRLVVSGGMFVGLLRGDARAKTVLCHELAHVVHADRLLLVVLGLAIIELAGRFVQSLWVGIAGGLELAHALFMAMAVSTYGLVVFGVVTAVVSRYREYYADAAALACFDDNRAYAAEIRRVLHGHEHRWSFFHPDLEQRLEQLERGFPVLRKVWFWRVFWPLNAAIHWLQTWFYRLDSEVGHHVDMAYYGMYACLAAWVFVMFVRPRLIRADTFDVASPAAAPSAAADP